MLVRLLPIFTRQPPPLISLSVVWQRRRQAGLRHLCVSCLPERPQRTEYSPLLHNQLLCPRSTTTNHKRSSSTTQSSFAYILNLLSTFSTNFAYSTFSPFSSPILSHTTGCIGTYSSSTTKPATLWILHVPPSSPPSPLLWPSSTFQHEVVSNSKQATLINDFSWSTMYHVCHGLPCTPMHHHLTKQKSQSHGHCPIRLVCNFVPAHTLQLQEQRLHQYSRCHDISTFLLNPSSFNETVFCSISFLLSKLVGQSIICCSSF